MRQPWTRRRDLALRWIPSAGTSRGISAGVYYRPLRATDPSIGTAMELSTPSRYSPTSTATDCSRFYRARTIGEACFSLSTATLRPRTSRTCPPCSMPAILWGHDPPHEGGVGGGGGNRGREAERPFSEVSARSAPQPTSMTAIFISMGTLPVARSGRSVLFW
jgi:hypothetical protein